MEFLAVAIGLHDNVLSVLAALPHFLVRIQE
jgi:hypothetical protein